MDELAAVAFSAFPNPSNGRFTVRAGAVSGNMSVRVSGIDGSLVHQERWTATQGAQLDMDLSALANGTYVVSLTTASGNTFRTRVVIQ